MATTETTQSGQSGAACPIPAAPTKSRRVATAVELSLIGLTLVAVWFATAGLSWSPELRWVFGYSAAVVLGQGLLRDLARIVFRRSPPGETQRLTCLCAESGLGLILLVLGAGGLTLLGVTERVGLDQTRLSAGLGALLVLGFVAKDYVVVVKRVEDHAAIRLW